MAKREAFETLAKVNHLSQEETELVYFEPGECVGPAGRYEIVNLLGAGVLGAVYLAKDYQAQEALLAIKFLLPAALKSPAAIEALQQGVKRAQGISHPHLLPVIALHQQGSLYFLTMEYIEGFSLRGWMEQHRHEHQYPSLYQVWYLMLQIVQGIEHWHQTSGYYGLKPEEILLSGPPEAYLVRINDLALAGLRRSTFFVQGSEEVNGKAYLAPEQCTRPEAATLQADVFSLGVIFYEMLTGQRPSGKFRNVSWARPDVPEIVEGIVEGTLEIAPSKRFNLPQLFAALGALRKECQTADGAIRESAAKTTRRFINQKAEIEKVLRHIEYRLSVRDLKEALQLIQDLMEKHPGEEEMIQKKVWIQKRYDRFLELLAETHRELVQSEYFKALEAVNKSLALYPQSEEAQNLKKSIEEKTRPRIEHYKVLWNQGLALKREKRYDEAIDVWRSAVGLTPYTRELEDQITIARKEIEQANELFKQAQEIYRQNPYKAFDLINEGLALLPQHLEMQSLGKEVVLKIQEREKKLVEGLQKGRDLAAQKRDEEAIAVWKTILNLTPRDSEVREEISKAQQRLTEARECLEKGKSQWEKFGDAPQALKWIHQSLGYNPCNVQAQELELTIRKRMEEREQKFAAFWHEGEHLFNQGRIEAAIESWQQGMNVGYRSEELAQKIEEAQKFLHRRELHGKDYESLLNTARELEKRENYEEALTALQMIREKRHDWVCPSEDPLETIERIHELAAAKADSEYAKSLLSKASTALERSQIKAAEQILGDPRLTKKLIPSAQKRLETVLKQVEVAKAKQLRRYQILSVTMGVLLLTLIFGYFFKVTADTERLNRFAALCQKAEVAAQEKRWEEADMLYQEARAVAGVKISSEVAQKMTAAREEARFLQKIRRAARLAEAMQWEQLAEVLREASSIHPDSSVVTQFQRLLIPPEIKLFASAEKIYAGDTVTFSCILVAPTNRSIAAVQWDFGDSSIATQEKVSHRFLYEGSEPSTISVRLQVEDNFRHKIDLQKTIVILPNQRPETRMEFPREASLGQEVIFRAEVRDPERNEVSCHWDFGDGKTAEGVSVTHRFTSGGVYPITLSVFDGLHTVVCKDQIEVK